MRICCWKSVNWNFAPAWTISWVIALDHNRRSQIIVLFLLLHFDQCNLDYCIERMANERKPGDCPTAVNTSLGQSPCFDDCNGRDYQCVGIQKCCPNGCHRICENALNLNAIDATVLPTIPMNVSALSWESEMRRRVRISWEMLHCHDNDLEAIDFIVEARVHVGHTFSPHKLSHWFVVHPTGREIQRLPGDIVR